MCCPESLCDGNMSLQVVPVSGCITYDLLKQGHGSYSKGRGSYMYLLSVYPSMSVHRHSGFTFCFTLVFPFVSVQVEQGGPGWARVGRAGTHHQLSSSNDPTIHSHFRLLEVRDVLQSAPCEFGDDPCRSCHMTPAHAHSSRQFTLTLASSSFDPQCPFSTGTSGAVSVVPVPSELSCSLWGEHGCRVTITREAVMISQ